MTIRLVQYRVLISLFVIILSVWLVVVSRPAFRQKRNMIVIREPGHRFLGPPQPAQPEAAIDLDYALLSQSAYGGTNKGKLGKGKNCIDAKYVLEAEGWRMWPNFPGTELEKQMDSVHLRAEIWSNRSKNSVVVAFGGTVFSSRKDWKSNLHWFNPFQQDEYSLITREFSPKFAEILATQQKMPGWEFLENATIYSTGHSLGGGLAEEFAYSLPASQSGAPHVSKVYAFDPSPVTGFLSVQRSVRDEDKIGLKIDRIYERGEVLAILRSITSAIHRPPAMNPEVRQLRYNLFGNDRLGLTNSIASHSIQDLACGLREAALR